MLELATIVAHKNTVESRPAYRKVQQPGVHDFIREGIHSPEHIFAKQQREAFLYERLDLLDDHNQWCVTLDQSSLDDDDQTRWTG